MSPRLVALTDVGRFPRPADTLRPLCELALPGAVAVVLRDRDAPLALRLDAGRALRELTAETGQRLFVSDRVDLALELGADGVHLPAGGLQPSHVEALFPGALVSRAHHDADELDRGELGRCSFVLVSPAFAERKGRPALGAAGLGARLLALRQRAPGVPLLALGGIDGESVVTALQVGADGVAAIGAAHDPTQLLALISRLGCRRS